MKSFVFFFVYAFACTNLFAQAQPNIKVMLDPGHGYTLETRQEFLDRVPAADRHLRSGTQLSKARHALAVSLRRSRRAASRASLR